MKHLLPLLAIFFIISCSITKTSNELDGTWIPVRQELGGAPWPDSTLSTESLVMNDSNYIFTAESVDKGIVRYSNGKLDVYGKDGVNAGKHFMGIYKIENGELFICYDLEGKNYPASYETKSGPMIFLSVFRKK